MLHELKTDPAMFERVASGNKNFEIRFDDRDYQVKDVLLLKETQYSGRDMKTGSALIYTGREALVRVTYVLRGPIYGLQAGWVIMSISVLELSDT